MSETLRGNNSQPDGGTLRGPQPDGGTLRGPQPDGGTLRGPQPDGGTLRGPQPDGGTLRGPQPDGGTLRGPQPDGGTLRGPQPDGGTLRGPQPDGGTLRAPQRDNPSKAYGAARHRNDAPKMNYTPQGNNVKMPSSQLKQAEVSEFVLNGVSYKVDGVISNSTGEAVIYKLNNGGREYALKLYYYGIKTDDKVMAALNGAKGSGFLVDVIEQGTYISQTGEARLYELQPYYSGGDLKPGMLAGQPDALKATALSMLMAVKTSHDHKILHRDIKPNNFIYTDPSHTSLVLCDFGIASTFNTDSKGQMRPLKTRAQFRTKIYAAPETYTVIDGEIEYDDVKSDYYSLGMSLLTLWMGEAPFAGYDERALLRLKKGESGTLPISEDMPAELKHLIKGLTVPNPDKRWGFDEFERWLRGDDVEVEGENRNTSGLNILYNGSKNQIANTFEELVQFMLQDTKLAKQYLYSGKISRWLADAQYPELQMQIDEFVNKTYPRNQDAGLWAVAYLLDGSMPFYSPKGGLELYSMEEIAEDMYLNAPNYLDEMANKDSLLYVYFRASGLNYSERFVPIAKEKSELHALWQMIFTIDPTAPFPMLNVENDKYVLVNTIDEMLDFMAKQPQNAYHDSNSMYPDLITDEAFLVWLGNRDQALEGKIRSKLSQEDMDMKAIYYYIFYLLDPERNYFLDKDRNYAFNIKQIAQLLDEDNMRINADRKDINDDLWNESYDRITDLDDFEGTRLYYYLKSKEVYKDQIDYINYVYETDSKDNERKAGPYNGVIARYKAIKALNGKVHYYFPKANVKVGTIAELSRISKAELKAEHESGELEEWLAVQYQEDPSADLSKDFEYEKRLAQYTEAIGQIDPESEEYLDYKGAQGVVEKRAKKCRSLIAQVKTLRWIWAALIALPLLAVALMSFWPGFAHFGHPDGWWECLIVVVIIAVAIRALHFIPILNDAIDYSLGPEIGDYMYNHRWQCSFAYSGIFVGLLWVLEHWGEKFGFIVLPIFCLLLLFMIYKTCIKDMPLMEKDYDDCTHPDTESYIIEPLFFAWKDDKPVEDYDAPIFERQDTYINCTEEERNMLIRRTLQGLIPVLLTIGVYAMVCPWMSDHIKATDPARWERVYGDKGSAASTLDIGDDLDLYYADVKSSLTVRAEPSTSATAIGTLGRGEEMQVIETDGNFAKIKYGDGIGYVSAKYIKKVGGDGAAPSATQTAPIEQTKPNKPVETQTEDTKQEEPAEEQTLQETPVETLGYYQPRSNYRMIDFYSRPLSNGDYYKGNIPNGAKFEVLSFTSEGYAKINYNGEIGYVERYLIEKVE